MFPTEWHHNNSNINHVIARNSYQTISSHELLSWEALEGTPTHFVVPMIFLYVSVVMCPMTCGLGTNWRNKWSKCGHWTEQHMTKQRSSNRRMMVNSYMSKLHNEILSFFVRFLKNLPWCVHILLYKSTRMISFLIPRVY